MSTGGDPRFTSTEDGLTTVEVMHGDGVVAVQAFRQRFVASFTPMDARHLAAALLDQADAAEDVTA